MRTYAEQHEDHGISAMAFINTVTEDPSYAATISLKQMTAINLFWKHPLRRDHKKWGAVWNAEKERQGKCRLSLRQRYLSNIFVPQEPHLVIL